MNSKHRVYLTPAPVRVWHWLNAFGILVLCVTGAEIRFPDIVSVFGDYRAVVRLHDAAGVVVALSYTIWFVYYAVVARRLVRLYVPTKRELLWGLPRQAAYYFYHYFRGTAPNPHRPGPNDKFNPLQKCAYLVVMFILTPLVIVSGLLLLNVAPLRAWVTSVGGLRFLVECHWLLACMFFAFVLVHVYLATMGHTPVAHIEAMWTGWEEHPAHDATEAA
ncbi:cytochrome b/b6 domain-containing protein [Deferrisoma sp.]